MLLPCSLISVGMQPATFACFVCVWTDLYMCIKGADRMHMAQAICVTAQDLGTALSLQSPCFYIGHWTLGQVSLPVLRLSLFNSFPPLLYTILIRRTGGGSRYLVNTRPVRGLEEQLHSFLTSALGRGEWSASSPGRFTPGERSAVFVNK